MAPCWRLMDNWPVRLRFFFDAVAVILSDNGAKALSMESAAIDFVRDALATSKRLPLTKGGQALLKTANVPQDAGVVDVNDKDAFINAAKDPALG